MDTPPLDFLAKVADGKLELTGTNVWKALKYRAFIQVIDRAGNVVSGTPKLDEASPLKRASKASKVPKLDTVSHFRVTERGKKLLDQSGEGGPTLPFNKSDPPLSVRLWASAFRRWCRNCPHGLQLTHADGQLHILVTDNQGNTANDDLHRLSSMKVPWHVIKS